MAEKTITVFGVECRLISTIKCDFCGESQIFKKLECRCGMLYSDSEYDVNNPPSGANYHWHNGVRYGA